MTDTQEPRILAQFEKNATETVQIRLEEFRGIETVDIRVFYSDATGALRPTKKGLCMARTRFSELADAVSEAAGKLGTDAKE